MTAPACPPHHWRVDPAAREGAFRGRCLKCGARRTWPLTPDADRTLKLSRRLRLQEPALSLEEPQVSLDEPRIGLEGVED